MPRSDAKWLKIFLEFTRDLRIASKELSTTDERGSPFNLWGSQRLFLEQLADGLEAGIRFFVWLKSRQLGVTTISLAIDVFWLAMHPNLIGALVSDTEKNRSKNRDLITRYVENLPEGYFGEKFSIERSNVNFIKFSNGARLDLLVAGTRSKKNTAWGEGEGYAMVHCTEVASYGDPEGLSSFLEALAQKNPDRLFIFESTAKGFNHFKDLWDRAKADPLTKRACFIGWWASEMNRIEQTDPRFQMYAKYAASGEERELVQAVEQLYGHRISREQLAWIRWKPTDTGSEDSNLTDQNQPWIEKQAFVQSGHAFFANRLIGRRMKELEEEGLLMKPYRYELGTSFFDLKMVRIIHQEEADQIELKVWEEPKEDAWYAIGCDPAFGRSKHSHDRSCVEVWRCYADKMVQVAEYATADHEVKHCAWVLAHLAGAYKKCMVNVELTGPGRMIMQEWEHLRTSFQAEMYYKQRGDRAWDDALSNAQWYLYHKPDSIGAGYAYNFETSWRTKQEIMHQMKGAFLTDELVIKSFHLLHEMSVTVQDGDEIGAPPSRSENCRDDRVFATALAIRAWLNWIKVPMIQAGESYEMVSQKETGEMTIQAQRLNEIVYKFFQRREDEANEADEGDRPKWLVDRGLI